MATDVIMPQMGFDMEEGTVVRWLKAEGDHVDRGEPIVEVETDKATVEVESFASGLLRRIVVTEGITVPVGQVIGIIGTAEEELPAADVAASTPPLTAVESSPPAPATPASDAPPTTAPKGDRVLVSPLARRIAEGEGCSTCPRSRAPGPRDGLPRRMSWPRPKQPALLPPPRLRVTSSSSPGCDRPSLGG